MVFSFPQKKWDKDVGASVPNLECLKFPKVRGKAWPLATLGVVAVARVSFARSVCFGMSCEPVRRMQTLVYLLCQKRAYTVGVSLEEHMHTGKENNGGPFPPWSSGAPNAIPKKKAQAFCLGVGSDIFISCCWRFIFSFLSLFPGDERDASEAQRARKVPQDAFVYRFFCIFLVSLLRSGWL